MVTERSRRTTTASRWRGWIKTLGHFGPSWGRNARSNLVPRVLSYWDRGYANSLRERPRRDRAGKPQQTNERTFSIFWFRTTWLPGRLFSRGVIFTRARVSLALLSLRKNGGLLVVYPRWRIMDNRLVNEGNPRLFWILDSKKVPNATELVRSGKRKGRKEKKNFQLMALGRKKGRFG